MQDNQNWIKETMASKEETELWAGYQWDGVIDEQIFEKHRRETELAFQEYEREMSKVKEKGKDKISLKRGQNFRHEKEGEVCTLQKCQKRHI